MAPKRRESEIQDYWEAFRAANGVDEQHYDVFAFGDSPEMADELLDLVLQGPKRATAGLLLEFEHDREPVPRQGTYSVVLDGRGKPGAVLRSTHVEVKPLREVDADFAWDEGEGDRTLEWWLDAHRRFFGRRCEALGSKFSDDLPTVFERFEVVWPAPGS